MAKAMNADSFKGNFIESYIGNVQVQDNDEKKRLINLRRIEAESIADEIISNTEALVKNSGISNSHFAYATLAEKLKITDGYKDLLTSDGKAINLERLNGLLGKEIEKQQIIEAQANQESNKEKESDPFLNAMIENERLKEEEIKKRLEKIDFEHLSTNDIVFIGENLDTVLQNLNDEEIGKVSDTIFYGQDESVQKVNKEMLLIYATFKKNGNSALTEEQIHTVEEYGKRYNYDKEWVVILENFGENVQKIPKEILKISYFMKEEGETSGELTPKQVSRRLNLLNSPENKKMFNELGTTPEKFLFTQMVRIQEELEKYEGIKIKIPEYVVKDDDMAEMLESMEMEADSVDRGDENFDFEDIDFGAGFQELTGEDNPAINPEDITPEHIEKFVNRTEQEYFNSREKTSEAQAEAGQVAQESEQLGEIDSREKLLTEDKQVQQGEQITQGDTEPEMTEPREVPETPESESTYDSKENEVEAQENPLKKFFTRIYNAVTRKNRPALDVPQVQAEATSKPRAFDNEDVGAPKQTKTARLDITDRSVIPTGKGIRNSLIGIGDSFMKGIGSVFRSNKNKADSTPIANRAVTPRNTFDLYTVKQEELNNGQGPKPIIPTNVKAVNRNTTGKTNSDDEGISFDD